jgi:hypothetical protein
MPAPIPFDPNFSPVVPEQPKMVRTPSILYTAGGDIIKTPLDGKTLILETPTEVENANSTIF